MHLTNPTKLSSHDVPCKHDNLNSFFFCFITTTCDTWKMFNEAYMLKGPAYSNATLFQYMYENAFSLFDLGYASAIGVVLSVIMIAISVVQFIARSRQNDSFGR